MTASNWQRWYREGTVSVTNNSKTITGSGTYWSSASIKAGDVFSLDGVTDYEVATVNNDTTITLATVYTGKTATAQEYHIHRAFSASTGAEVAAQTAALVQDMARYVDSEHATIHGKSAYEIAKVNGYVGTEQAWLNSLVGKNAYEVAVAGGYKGTLAEWLESLKAAGEWTTLDTRTKLLAQGAPYSIRNNIVRGANLGSHPTAAHYKAIRTGTYDGMLLGDTWNGWKIAGFNLGVQSFSVNVIDPETGESRRPYGATVDWGCHYGGDVWLVKKFEYSGFFNKYTGVPAGCYYTDEDRNEDGTFVGYLNCNWYRNARPAILADAMATFGKEHLFEWNETVPTGYSATGKVTGTIRSIMKCEMITHSMLYGHDRPEYQHIVNLDQTYGLQFPLVRENIKDFLIGLPFYLRDILYGANNRLYSGLSGAIGYSDSCDTTRGQNPEEYWTPCTAAVICIGSMSEAADSTITVPES